MAVARLDTLVPRADWTRRRPRTGTAAARRWRGARVDRGRRRLSLVCKSTEAALRDVRDRRARPDRVRRQRHQGDQAVEGRLPRSGGAAQPGAEAGHERDRTVAGASRLLVLDE